jgi:hypothetical protein
LIAIVDGFILSILVVKMASMSDKVEGEKTEEEFASGPLSVLKNAVDKNSQVCEPLLLSYISLCVKTHMTTQ